ncbi:hypothetical protein BDZ88DRAFT_427556 [Geranomyces variabilis]|nr:hypothetical protein BDZ88DRAFT_427556 [Geranomyces variabilis]KAJ3132418.1 hypothetical protein HDU90_006933 [Geranomyces variabilis]
MSGIINRATETAYTTAQSAAAIVDPYVPQVAKNAATYAISTAQSTKDRAVNTVNGAATMASNTVTGAATMASNTVTGTVNFATGKVYDVIDFGKVVVNGATTTITAYTPNPILNLINSTLSEAKSLREDPVSTVKHYVPTFVIHAGEKTYEIGHNTKDRTVSGVNATTGYIVTKVEGVVTAVTSVPQIHALIEQLNKITTPVLNKLGVTKAPSPPTVTVVSTPGVATIPAETAAPATH